MYAYGANNPVRYIDPTGEFAVGVALSITVLTLATYYALLNYYQNPEVQEANRQLAEAAALGIETAKQKIKNAFSKSKNKNDSEAKPAEEPSALPKDGAESGKQSLPDMKKNPPKHPDYKPPKNWDGKKVKTPDGKGSGWPVKNGDVWEPTDHKGTHAPHWDVQHGDGTHTPVYPE